jgi:hypothetical protein
MKKFESKKDLEREELAINFFCNHFNRFNLTYKKLDEFNIDYNIFQDGKHKANVEVKGRLKTIAEAYPLPIAVRKILKLADSNSNPIIIWSCDDGIIFANLKSLVGRIKYGGRVVREGATNDMEIMAYYNKQECLKEIKFN